MAEVRMNNRLVVNETKNSRRVGGDPPETGAVRGRRDETPPRLRVLTTTTTATPPPPEDTSSISIQPEEVPLSTPLVEPQQQQKHEPFVLFPEQQQLVGEDSFPALSDDHEPPPPASNIISSQPPNRPGASDTTNNPTTAHNNNNDGNRNNNKEEAPASSVAPATNNNHQTDRAPPSPQQQTLDVTEQQQQPAETNHIHTTHRHIRSRTTGDLDKEVESARGSNEDRGARSRAHSVSSSATSRRHSSSTGMYKIQETNAMLRLRQQARFEHDPSTSPDLQGAYKVVNTGKRPEGEVTYHVSIPPGCPPGGEFMALAGNRTVRVRCPDQVEEDGELRINLPHDWIYHYIPLKPAPLTAATGPGGGGAFEMMKNIQQLNEEALKQGARAETYVITLPQDAEPNKKVICRVNGMKLRIRCPPDSKPGQRIRIHPPPLPKAREPPPPQQIFAVNIPDGVGPGQSFTFLVSQSDPQSAVQVTCPENAGPDDTIHVSLPTRDVVDRIQLAYPSVGNGWRRTVRADDLQFQWIPDKNVGNDPFTKAYCRKLTFLEGNDPRMPTATLELVNAEESVVDSRLKDRDGQTIFSYAEVSFHQSRPFEEKYEWFLQVCKTLKESFKDKSYIMIIVRRDHLLEDSLRAIVSLGPDELQRQWKINFLGEPARDEGGPAREWFELVSKIILDPENGLFTPSFNNQAAVELNPASGVAYPGDHLVYFRFIGRLLGRALYDGQLVKGHLIHSLYKHLLGWPVTSKDVKDVDEEFHRAMRNCLSVEDISEANLSFLVTEEFYGRHVDRELIDGGSNIDVVQENLSQYLEATIRYRVFNRCLPQLTELLLGFYDVVPETALTVFDANELELALCGLPSIDVGDWRDNTAYQGQFETDGSSDHVIDWFWEVVEEFDKEMRARLLQFATGSSGVPAKGFAGLRGRDGELRAFTIEGVDPLTCLYPRSHTCFNRIDLPLYSEKEQLRERLSLSIKTTYVGFDDE